MNITKKFHAWALYRFNREYEKIVLERKQRLLGSLDGTVVEIGPGTGPNLKFYKPDISWIGIEPNQFMYPYIRSEAVRLGFRDIEIIRQGADLLPFPDGSIDAVVATLVLCSVPSQTVVLAEIVRVLRPGGVFVFIEHVGSPRGTRMRRFQGLIKPFWRAVADGCNPDCDTLEAIARTGFSHIESENFKIYDTFVSPHIAGKATK